LSDLAPLVPVDFFAKATERPVRSIPASRHVSSRSVEIPDTLLEMARLVSKAFRSQPASPIPRPANRSCLWHTGSGAELSSVLGSIPWLSIQ